jgi:hypothetical protein
MKVVGEDGTLRFRAPLPVDDVELRLSTRATSDIDHSNQHTVIQQRFPLAGATITDHAVNCTCKSASLKQCTLKYQMSKN